MLKDFFVRFQRWDCQPDELYFYGTVEEASWMFNQFLEDDSNLYQQITIEQYTTEKIIAIHTFYD